MTRIRIKLKSKSTVSLLLVGLLLCAGLLAGCSKKQPPAPSSAPKPVQQPIKPVVQKSMSSVRLLAEQSNQLDFSGKKDPFKPYVTVKAASSADKRSTRSLLPIHSFDVSQFRLIGIVTDSKGNKAMVVDPAHKGYVLKVGMTIGKNEGKVVRIDTAGVDVLEQFRDENNKTRKETIRIPLLRKP